MKNFLLSLLLAAPLAAIAAPMTNDDVIKMVKGGLSDTTVLQAIEGAEPGFDTSPDGLVKLKQGGVSESVIQRILARRSTAPAVAAPVAATPAAAAAPLPVASCRDCGTITGIQEIAKSGQASGTGAITGAVLGGVLGYAAGGSRNRAAGTVVGATGGAIAGHMIEKKAASGKTFEISVRFDDGGSRTFMYDAIPAWNTGSRVKLVNGALAPL